MNKIQQMVHDLCPNGVEWKTLGEVLELHTGEQLNKSSMFESGKYPVINGGISPSGYIDEYNEEADTITISQGGASAGYVNFMPVPFWAGAHCFVIVPNERYVNKRYLYHFLTEKQKELQKSQQGAGIPSIHRDTIKKMPIPIPPLSIQAEIVNLLDKFTQLLADLKTELKLRRKQYDYYRNHLLSFDANSTTVQWMTLGEVAEFTYGFTDKAKNEGDIRYIRITDIDKSGSLSPFDAKYISYTDDVKNYILQKDDIVMARTGATFGKTMIFSEDYPAVYASFLIKISLNKSILLPKYYWHFAQSSLYWEQANKLVTGGAQPQFNAGAISQVRLPIPPIAEQERIVGILDKFETLVNDLSKGLPAEIALVQKQYEYYRNMLLTFE